VIPIAVMFHEPSSSTRELSRQHSENYYGRYAIFASLPLLVAVLETQTYSVHEFARTFGDSHIYSHNPLLSEFVNGLTSDDKDYFTVEEARFLIQLTTWCAPVTDEQLEWDRQRLSREARQGKNTLKSHAKILLKAVMLWKLRYNDKNAEWRQKYMAADNAFVARRRVENGFVSANGRTADEGYQSGGLDSDSEESDDDDDDDDETGR
jgi:hypothetical protein